MKDIIERLKHQVAFLKKTGHNAENDSLPVLLSASAARAIIEGLEVKSHCIPTREQVIEIMLEWVSHNEPIESTADKILKLLSAQINWISVEDR